MIKDNDNQPDYAKFCVEMKDQKTCDEALEWQG